MSPPSVAVVGGSLGGLTTALLLRDAGCEVQVHERSPSPPDARGAGIAVLEQTLRYPVGRLGVAPETFTTHTDRVRFLEPDGAVAHVEQRTNRFSAWNTLYRVLHDAFPDDRYHLGHEVTGFRTDPDGVDVVLADGATTRVDLLVLADGIGSLGRRTLFPDVAPRYAGYVAWRGTVRESDLSDATYQALHDALTYQVLPFSHVLVYPIPGLDGAVEPGRRLINMVWYRNVAEPDLPAFLTDRGGIRREVSLPPGHVPGALVEEMREFAAAHLAPPIAEVATTVEQPFVQAVFDIEVPGMARDRAVLLGDAAFAVRPHAAAGTAKAAEDGWVLAEEVAGAAGDLALALPRWEQRQLALGAGLLARTRDIGESSQMRGDFHAGDPRLVFGLYGPGR